MSTINKRQSVGRIRKLEEFNSGTLTGRWADNENELPYRYNGSDLAFDFFPVYVVASYDMPIAKVDNGGVTITDKKFSVTTSKHTGLAGYGLSLLGK